jgi:hypothetical protein
MILKNLIISTILLVLIYGCKSVPDTVPEESILLPWPTPLSQCEITTVRIDPETGDVIISYKDNLKIENCQNDKIRYIKDLSNLICKLQPSSPECKNK